MALSLAFDQFHWLGFHGSGCALQYRDVSWSMHHQEFPAGGLPPAGDGNAYRQFMDTFPLRKLLASGYRFTFRPGTP
jgi:hypothetical protein